MANEIKNNMPQIYARIQENIKARTDKLAKDGYYETKRDMAMRAYTHSVNPYAKKNFQTMRETGASIASIYYYLTDETSNYDEQKAITLGRMNRLKHYGGRPNDDLIFEEHKPLQRHSEYVAGWATMSLIVAWWEYGHNNVFTGRREVAPVISYTLLGMKNRCLEYYRDILHKEMI